MIHKSIFTSALILIGLSIVFPGCGIFSIDKIEDNFLQKYENQTTQTIEIVFVGISVADTIRMNPNSNYVSKIGFSSTENNAIEEFADDLARSNVRVSMYANGLFVTQWHPPAGSFGISINSPFNYDSWKYEPIENKGATKGQIVLTVSNTDLIQN